MINSTGVSPKRGFTLVEIMVVAALASFFVLFLFVVMRNFSKGVVNVQRSVPLQRDLQLAKSIIEKDLLSAPRSSIGNVAPDPGFESKKLEISTPTAPGRWAVIPTRFRREIGIKYATGFITSHPDQLKNGEGNLLINTRGSVGLYTAFSSTFSCRGGKQYIFGAWVFTQVTNQIQTLLQLVGDPAATGWPESEQQLAFTTGSHWSPTPSAEIGRWVFLCRPFTAMADYNYGIRVGNASLNSTRLGTSLDDFIVTASSWTMDSSSNETLEFNNYVMEGPLKDQWVRLRYRWAPKGASGQLIRERIDPLTGAVLQSLDALNNIRRVTIAWDFGQSAPGVLPATPPPSGPMGVPLDATGTTWNEIFSKGMTFPLVVTLEVGNIGAEKPSFMTLSFSVFPEMP